MEKNEKETPKDRVKKIIDEQCRGSFDEFARRVGINKGTIHTWKSHGPKPAILKRIKEEFGVNPDWILWGDGTPYYKMGYSPSDPSVLKESAGDKDLFGRTEYVQAGGKNHSVTLFGEQRDGRDNDPDSNGRDPFMHDLEMLKSIHDSGNQMLIRAIHSNLVAFSSAALSEHRSHTTIAALRRDLDDLRKRIDPIETDYEARVKKKA